jgi:enoyl-CoA hydratase/carnithine racemase
MRDPMSEILQHLENGVLTLTFNREARKNSLNRAMYSQLAEIFRTAADKPEVRVAVLQGAENIFTAGNDIADFLEFPPIEIDAPVFQFMFAMSEFPKPIIAAVCGPAVGIGTTLLMHCEMVLAGDNAAFAMPFINLGVCPENASSLLAPQIFGYQRAAELLLLGEAFNADTALEIGLVNKILPPSEVNISAQALAKKLAAKPLSSILATKALLKKGQMAQITQAITDEAKTFGQMLGEPAAKEAMSAFMEKRKPDFSQL